MSASEFMLMSRYADHGNKGYPNDWEDAKKCLDEIKLSAKRELLLELRADMANHWPSALDEVCDWLDAKLKEY